MEQEIQNILNLFNSPNINKNLINYILARIIYDLENINISSNNNSVNFISVNNITTNGTSPVRLSDIPAKNITLDNMSDSDILIGYSSSNTAPNNFINLPKKSSRTLPCISNTKEWWIKLYQNGADVTIQYIATA